MRFRGVSMTMVGAATLLLAEGVEPAAAQGRGIGVLRPAPRPSVGGGARPRLGVTGARFATACFLVPGFSFSPFFPVFGGASFSSIQLFAGSQPAPDPTSHPVPDPASQPVPFPGSHAVPTVQPVPGQQPVPGLQPVPNAVTTNPHAVPAFAAPVYSAPVYSTPVYGGAAPVATPRVSGGMVVGDVIDDPTFGLWGSSFFGGGFVCAPARFGRRGIVIR